MRGAHLLLGASLLVVGSSLRAQDVQTDRPAPVASTADQPAMSDDEIYMKVFGRERPKARQAVYPMTVDGVLVGDAMMDPEGEGWVSSDAILRLVSPILLPDAEKALRSAASGDHISFSTLRSLSWTVEFDTKSLVLSISVPMDMRSVRTVLLSGPPHRDVVDYLPQAGISAYLSARMGMDWIEAGPLASGSPSGFVADLDGALNIHGVVLEGRVRYAADRDRRWQRDDVRIVYDDVSSLVRYEAGDLTIGRRPNQASPRLAGLAAYREFRIDPYDDPRPQGERGLVLERPAQVEIVVNGATVRTVSLPAGRFSLRDFPLMPGAANDIEFIITYATGEVERVSFPAFGDIDLLEEGRSEFAANAGVPYEVRDGVRRYDTGDPSFIGFWRRGFSPVLTAGGSIAANSDLLLVGPDIVWASPIGSFGISAEMDLMHAGLDSSRLTLRHSLRGTNPDRGLSLDSIVILTGRDYRTLDRLFGDSISTVFVQSRLSLALDERTRVQFGGGFERSTEERVGDRWSAGITASRRIGRMSLIGSLDWTQDRSQSEVAARISLFVPLGRASLSSSYSSRGNVLRSEYRSPAGTGVGSFGYGGGFEFRDGGDRQFAYANYVGNRFEAAVDQERVATNGYSDVRTGLSFGTALVMADGRFGLSRPVTGSFAIVGKGASGDDRIAVEPRSRSGGRLRYSAWSDALGPAVVPDLPGYLVRGLEVAAPKAPAGSGIGGEVFMVKPGYKAGYFLPVGKDAGSVSALGNLVSVDGSPIAYASGTVRRIGEGGSVDGNGEAVIFTTASGRFFVEGLEPGASYEAILDAAGRSIRFEFTVPADSVGIWRIADPIEASGGLK